MKKSKLQVTTFALLFLLLITLIEVFLSFIAGQRAPEFVVSFCDYSAQHKCLASGLYYLVLEGLPTLLLLLFFWTLILRKLMVSKPFLILVTGFFFWLLILSIFPINKIYLLVGNHNPLYYFTRAIINVLFPYSLAYFVFLLFPFLKSTMMKQKKFRKNKF
jgi:hypothetical protein